MTTGLLNLGPASWGAHAPEARAVAMRLRASRLTVLCGARNEANADLLRDGVMPLLQRRASDSPIAPASKASNVLPFADRRRSASAVVAALPDFEVAVLLERWRAPPLLDLDTRIGSLLCISLRWVEAAGDTLASRLQSFGQRFGARFLILCDGFEQALEAAESDPACARFLDELADVICTPELAAHVLLSVSEESSPRFQAFLRRCPDPSRPALCLADLASWHHTSADAAKPARTAIYLVPPPQPSPQQTARRLAAMSPVWTGLAALVVLAGVVWWLSAPAVRDRPPVPTASSAPPRAALVGSASAPTARPQGLPAAVSAATTFNLAVDSDEGGLSELADDLARLPALGLHVTPSSGWAESLAAPGLAVVRYDALQAWQQQRPDAQLRLVTPLVMETLYFVTRADAALAHVHDIEAARINTGPADGSRALTAQTVYQRLFMHALPAAQTSVSNRDVALRELLEARSVDVIVIADAQPSAWLLALPPAQAAAIKLLPLTPEHPASRRALRSYLPSEIPVGGGAGPTASMPSLGVMSFVVAGDPAVTPQKLARWWGEVCRSLPDLKQRGHPRWRDWQPGQRLPAGWPYVDPASDATAAASTTNPASTDCLS